MKKLILQAVIPVFLVLQAEGQGFKIPLMGQKQASMGSTGAGYVFGGSTIYFNPGGLSFIQSSDISLGGSALIPQTEFVESGTHQPFYTQPKVFTPFAGYFSLKINPKFAAGIGVYTPYGSGLTWPDDFSGRYILHSILLQTVYIQPTISYRISKMVGIGAGFVYALGNVSLSKDIPLANEQDNNPRASLTGTGNGWGYTGGVYVQPDDRLSIGLSYHSSVKLDVKNGNANFTGVPTSLQADLQNTTFSTSLPMPADLTLGFGLRLDSSWLITLDADEVFWNTYDTLAFQYKNQTALLTNSTSQENYHSVPGVRAGVQYSPSKKVDIRAGAFFEATPVPKGNLQPSFPDNDHIGLTAGIGVHATTKLDIDVSFMFVDVLKRTDSDNAANFSGTYKSNIYAPGLGISYSF